MRVFFCFLALLLGAVASFPADVQYTVADLGTMQSGSPISINNEGAVLVSGAKNGPLERSRPRGGRYA